jgi:hypothetical protein
MIERNFAEALEEVTKEGADHVRQINDEEGVKWLFSFLSPDKRKTYCLSGKSGSPRNPRCRWSVPRPGTAAQGHGTKPLSR